METAAQFLASMVDDTGPLQEWGYTTGNLGATKVAKAFNAHTHAKSGEFAETSSGVDNC